MKIERAVQLLSRLPIRHRDTGSMVSFIPNPNQLKMIKKLAEMEEKKKPLWFIVCKSRRVGVSSLTDGLMIPYAMSVPHADCLIVAHLAESSKALFQIPSTFSRSLEKRIAGIDIQSKTIRFPTLSKLTIATAGSVAGGRGMTNAALHLSEGAHFVGSESFTALIPTVQYQPNTMLAVESTANGRIGIGEPFYDYWTAAVEGRNEFVPMFFSWLEDPACNRPESEAEDAPANDYEKDLMKTFRATKSQIAWARWCLETVCNGVMDRMLQEYAHTPEVAFISTGNPAFDRQEMTLARNAVKKPTYVGYVRIDDGKPRFVEGQGQMLVWELPKDGAHYYIGVDAAKGTEYGDFACIFGINGCTGEQAFRVAMRIGPESLSELVYAIAIYYNRAMVNVEITGGWGYIVLKELRDKYSYPNQYMWRSRDDKTDTRPRNSLGWETGERTRRMAFDLFRTALRRKKVTIFDEALIQQMSRATNELDWRWTVRKGHDDILFGALLAWICVEQYHTYHGSLRSKLLDVDGTDRVKGIDFMEDPMSHADGVIAMTSEQHLKKIKVYGNGKNQKRTGVVI